MMLEKKFRKFFRLLRSNDPRDRIFLERRLGGMPILGLLIGGSQKLRARLTQHSPEDYVRMQRKSFELYASADKVTSGVIDGDYVVGSWRSHDEWPDYEDYLMKYVPRDASWLAIDFGCGPGRNIRRWSKFFRRIDGADIATNNLENAKKFLSGCLPPEKMPQLFLTRGMDCGDAPHNYYDFAFSTICLQHICVHKVRFGILSNLFACLKPGGRLSIQMGYGVPSPSTVGYFDDYVQAAGTNRLSDVAISSPSELQQDLEKIGFVKFEYWIRPVGPGDIHPNWIFATAVKPQA